MAHNERLDGKEATPAQAKAPKAPPQAAPHYKHRFHKTTAFKAARQPLRLKRGALGQSPQAGEGSEEPEDIEEDQAGLLLPEFLKDMPDGDWGLHARLAQAMQAEEKRLRCCFVCQSSDHLMHDCPTAKNWAKAPKAEGGLPKTSQ